MENTYTTMMSGVPAAVLIWLGLIGVSAVAFALFAAVAGRSRRSGSAAGPGTGPVAAGHAPRNEAVLRALAAARAVTSEEAAPAATRPATLTAAVPRPREAMPVRSQSVRSQPVASQPVEPAAAVTDVLPVVVEENEPTSEEQRFADELATAAARAGVTADRRQAEWEHAQRAVDSAWKAYEEAENAARRAIRAAAFPTPETPLTPAEYAERERYLHRAARAAHARGELDTDQLIDALSHRNGFDPRLHPFEQDALLRRCTRDRLLRVYQKAAEAERAAWREADRATAARHSLEREAAAAARNVPPQPQPVDASRRFSVRVPVLSLR